MLYTYHKHDINTLYVHPKPNANILKDALYGYKHTIVPSWTAQQRGITAFPAASHQNSPLICGSRTPAAGL